MSEQPPVWFVAIMEAYLAAWRQPLDVKQTRAYWQALSDCEESSVRQAALDLQRMGGEFPRSSGDWYRRAIDLERSTRLHETIRTAREEPWHVECEDCEDTGFSRHHCNGTGADGCPRCRRLGIKAHEWVEVCACRPTNRTYARKREHERVRRVNSQPAKRGDAGTTGGWSKTSARDWTGDAA